MLFVIYPFVNIFLFITWKKLNFDATLYISPEEWTGGQNWLASESLRVLLSFLSCTYFQLHYSTLILKLSICFWEKILDKTLLVFWSNPWTNNYWWSMVNMHTSCYVQCLLVICYNYMWFWNKSKSKSKVYIKCIFST